MPLSKMRVVASVVSFTLSLPLLLLYGAGSQTAAQTESRAGRNRRAQPVTPFARVYRSYLDATNQDEASGLRKVAVPDFAIQDDYLGKTLRGNEAFAYAEKIYDGTKNDQGHSMRFVVAKQTEQYATVYAEETISSLVDVSDSLTPEQRAGVSAKGLKTTSKSTMTWRWKHTWRNTPQGWKLASLARDDRPKGERHGVSGAMYSVGIKPSVIPPQVKLAK